MFPPQSTPSMRPKRRVESNRIYKRPYSACSHFPDHPLRVTENATRGKLVGPTYSCLQKGTSITINIVEPRRPGPDGREILGLLVYVDRMHLYASHQLPLCSKFPHFHNYAGKLTQFDSKFCAMTKHIVCTIMCS